MLETLLEIGKTLREAKQLRHHRYIKQVPISDKKSPVVYLTVPVDKDFNIDFNGLSEILDEDLIRHKLYYLAFKSSGTDSMVKYIFGDILYGINKGKEEGYYRMSNPEIKNKFSLSSFYRAKEDAETFKGSVIEKFRQAFEINIDTIENLLKEKGQNQQVFLHFDFQGKHWYEFEDEINAINKKLLADFLEEQAGKYILRKFLYKTLIYSTSQSPGFNSNNIFKTKAFKNHDEVMDLFYAIDYSEKSLINDRSIKIVILPKGNNLESSDIEEFFERKNNRDIYSQNEHEEKLKKANEAVSTENLLDDIFEPILVNVAKNITQFDFTFSKKNASGPDVDMIELSGIERSFLNDIGQRAKTIRDKVNLLRKKELFDTSDKLKPFNIRRSFMNILGDVTKDKKKYQSHILRVLPQIYTGTYYQDDLLLPAFIEKVEYNVRNGEGISFNLLKYDYYFLIYLQNRNGENLMEEMKTSKSYQAGLLLGKIARPLDGKIASFQKNYVGLLSRRISDKQGLIKFANFINEKLAIHDVAYPSLKQAFIELADLIGNISDKDYHKNYCAFGFFESYFAKFEAKINNTELNQNKEN